MILNSKLKLVPLGASLALCGLGLAGNAEANAYSLSYDNISNFLIPNPTNVVFGTPSVSSADSASMNGSGISNNSTATTPYGPSDTKIATVGTPTEGEDAYMPLGQTGNYAWGDGDVFAQQTNNTYTSSSQCAAGGCGHFQNAAESNMTLGTAAAAGNNNSGTFMTVPITVSNSGTFTMEFNAEPYLQTFLAANSKAGSQAAADLSVTATLYSLDAAGNTTGTVMTWTPNGNSATDHTISGGVTVSGISDPQTLNITSTQLLPGGTTTYDPFGATFGTGTGSGGLYSITVGGLGSLNGSSAPSYQLALAMKEDVAVAAVPEPANVALFMVGLGLVGAAKLRRRKA